MSAPVDHERDMQDFAYAFRGENKGNLPKRVHVVGNKEYLFEYEGLISECYVNENEVVPWYPRLKFALMRLKYRLMRILRLS